MKQKVTYVVDGGMGGFKCSSDFDPEENPEIVAEDCAQNYHAQHDGRESQWPVDITLLREDGSEICTCEVDIESQPVFSARKKEIEKV
jgi:hypothetical protein